MIKVISPKVRHWSLCLMLRPFSGDSTSLCSSFDWMWVYVEMWAEIIVCWLVS